MASAAARAGAQIAQDEFRVNLPVLFFSCSVDKPLND